MVWMDTYPSCVAQRSNLEGYAMSQTKRRLLSMKDVQKLTSYSRTHIARLEESGKFPKRVRLSPHPRGRMAFVEGEVNDWIDKHISDRST